MDLGSDIKVAQNGTLAQRLDAIGWALFLIMIGTNVGRHVKGLRVSGFSAVLGMIALALGLSAIAGGDLPVLPILIAAIGLQMIYSVVTSKRGAR